MYRHQFECITALSIQMLALLHFAIRFQEFESLLAPRVLPHQYMCFRQHMSPQRRTPNILQPKAFKLRRCRFTHLNIGRRPYHYPNRPRPKKETSSPVEDGTSIYSSFTTPTVEGCHRRVLRVFSKTCLYIATACAKRVMARHKYLHLPHELASRTIR